MKYGHHRSAYAITSIVETPHQNKGKLAKFEMFLGNLNKKKMGEYLKAKEKCLDKCGETFKHNFFGVRYSI